MADNAGARRDLGLRVIARAAAYAAGRLAYLIATIWRVLGALDAALWRGAVLVGRAIARGGAFAARAVAGGVAEFVQWLPTRGGIAYSAASGVVLMISGLWIVDELRRAAAQTQAEATGGVAPDGRPARRSDPIVARIDGTYVTLSTIATASRAAGLIGPNEPLSHRAAFERGLVEAYVEQRVLAEAALREGAHRDPGVRDRLLAARDRILAAAFLDRRVSEAATPAAARAIFDAQSPAARLGDEVDARHIVVATKKEAENIVVALNGGADFAALARARSLDDATGPRGGRIGYFARSMMTPGLARAAFATPVGALAPPFETDYGWHVLEVLDRRAGRAPTFEDAREGVQRFLADRAIETGVAAAFERASTDYYPPPPRDDGSDPETGAAPGASETAAPQSASIEGLNN